MLVFTFVWSYSTAYWGNTKTLSTHRLRHIRTLNFTVLPERRVSSPALEYGQVLEHHCKKERLTHV